MTTNITKNIGTISLTANEIERVTLPASYGFVWVKNMSDGDIYISLNDEFTAGEDGVIDIPKGECARLQGDTSTVYLLGSGSALVVAQNFSSCPFKLAAKGGEGGGSSPEWDVDSALSLFSENPVQNKVITAEINKKADAADIPTSLPANGGNADTVNGHSVDCDVPADAVFTDTVLPVDGVLDRNSQNAIANSAITDYLLNQPNPNLLINPDFKINQRGKTDFSVDYHAGHPISQSQKYTVDRWRIMEGTANISNGKFVLTGTIIQVLENSIGGDFTASVSVESGTATASYDDSTKTFSIVGNGAVLKWAKLEHGKTATPFVPPEPATELVRCQRYYQIVDLGQPIFAMGNGASIIRFGFTLPTALRANPTAEFMPITGDYTWSIQFVNLNTGVNTRVTDVPTAIEVVVRTLNYLNIKLTVNSTEIVTNMGYLMHGAGGFAIKLDAEIY